MATLGQEVSHVNQSDFMFDVHSSNPCSAPGRKVRVAREFVANETPPVTIVLDAAWDPADAVPEGEAIPAMKVVDPDCPALTFFVKPEFILNFHFFLAPDHLSLGEPVNCFFEFDQAGP